MTKNQFDNLPDIELLDAIRNAPDSSKIEPRFKESIDRYVSDKIPTGGFLKSVLENDLAGAIGTADINAMNNLKHIVCYLWNEVPAPCWGSKEKVKKWLEDRTMLPKYQKNV